jgi:hypothetical protein
MKLIIKFSIFREGISKLFPYANELKDDEYHIIKQKYPEACLSNRFEYKGDPDSELTKFIINDLSKMGRPANWNRFDGKSYTERKASREFSIQGERHFNSLEIENADYFWCYAQKELTKGGFRQDSGILEVERKSITAQVIGRSLGGFNILFKESIKELIFNQDFQNLVLKPVRVKGKLPPKELLWEVWSEKSLPSVLNPLVNELGEEPDESAHGCWVNDLYFPPVLKFNKAQVEAELGEFDVAITKERWHGGVWQRRSPYVIVSRRFREWCLMNKFKMTWVPVEMV